MTLSSNKITLSLCATVLITACSNNVETTNNMNNTAPIAKKIPYEITTHQDTRIDNYYWMRDDTRTNPEILAHLEAENDYSQTKLAHTTELQAELFNEIKNRIDKDDNSVPIKEGNYFYSYQMHGSSEYPVYIRATDFNGNNSQVLLDVNELAKEHDYYQARSLRVSPNEKMLAYGEDTVSRRIYDIRFKDIKSGDLLSDTLSGTSGSIEWGNDNKTVYYIKKDPQTLLGYQVFRHILGTKQAADQLIYEEADNTYYTFMSKEKDGSNIYIWHSSTETKGVSLIDANNNKSSAIAFIPKDNGIEYTIAKLNDWFYIKTNWQATNFRLMKVHQSKLGNKKNWQNVIAANNKVKLDDFELFNDHLVYQQRENGLTTVTVQQLSTGKEQQLNFNDSAFSLHLYGNYELDNTSLRVYYSSFTTPGTDYDIDLTNFNKTQLKQTKILGDFDAKNYRSERIFITAKDGEKIPVSLVYRKDKFKKDGTNSLYQYGYGSYGNTIDPSFSSSRLSLLDRGFVYAVAHVRGSQMLGRPWYEQGKKLEKVNTFTDFIDVTNDLVAQGYGDKNNVFAAGGSAGGLLMGAIMNMAPELYNGVAAAVPFVDVVTTMLDESIPLTTNEFDEWGNPKDKTYYDYMLSYSPYDQVRAQAYPNVLVTTGLHDSQVQYFEPMKWVAKLREYKTDDNLLLFKTDMESGHGGASGRFKSINKKALQYAFFIDLIE